jgi:ornithine cyclodeaminase/alanine dehydrogenase-like protein (mu-crystallin family)
VLGAVSDKASSHSGKHDGADEDEEADEAGKGLREWLQKGNVVYKSVGLGLMDVVVGTDVVALADQRGIGTRIPDF